MCELPDDLMATAFLPLLLVAFFSFFIIIVFNNGRNGRGFTQIDLRNSDKRSSSDRNWQNTGLVLFAVSFGTYVLYQVVTSLAECIVRRLGECGHPIPGRDMWPAAVVFAIYFIAAGILRSWKFRTPPFSEVFGILTWGFLSLSVGFFVTVFSTNQTLLVWLPTFATVVSVAPSLFRIYRKQIGSIIKWLSTPSWDR